jgi:photosystem II stability/assembly factor-like uncharacterized protein
MLIRYCLSYSFDMINLMVDSPIETNTESLVNNEPRVDKSILVAGSPKIKFKMPRRRYVVIVAAVLILVLGLVFVLKLHLGKKADTQVTGSQISTGGSAKPSQPAVSCTANGDNRYYRTGRSLAINPQNPKHMFVAVEYKGMYVSEDGGTTWSQVMKDYKWKFGCFPEPFKTLVNPDNPNILYISMNGDGIYRSSDGGKKWNKIDKDWMYSKTEEMTFEPGNPKVIYATTNANRGGDKQDVSPVTKGLVYKTTDEGATWEELPTGLADNAGCDAVIPDINNPKHVIAYLANFQGQPGSRQASTENPLGVRESFDGGATWQPSHPLPINYESVSWAYYSQKNTNHHFVISFYPVDQPPKSFYSLDDGKSFTPSSRDFTYAAYDPFDSNGLRLLGFNGQPGSGNESVFYESLDGGRNWHSFVLLPTEQSNLADHKTLVSSIVWDPIDKNTLYETAASALIYKSTDNGKTWTKILSLDRV